MIADTELSASLGYKRPRSIRPLIRSLASRGELGKLASSRIEHAKGGRPGTCFFLTEKQAEIVSHHCGVVRNHDGWIYFIGWENSHAVKIGYTTDTLRRLSSVQTNVPFEVRYERTFRGTKALERALHEHCAAERLRREWFSRSGQVIAVLSMSAGEIYRRFGGRE